MVPQSNPSEFTHTVPILSQQNNLQIYTDSSKINDVEYFVESCPMNVIVKHIQQIVKNCSFQAFCITTYMYIGYAIANEVVYYPTSILQG